MVGAGYAGGDVGSIGVTSWGDMEPTWSELGATMGSFLGGVWAKWGPLGPKLGPSRGQIVGGEGE